MWQYIIPALATITVAIIELIAARDRKRASDREDIRTRESRLSMEMMNATLQLSLVTANALTGGHNNGNVEKAYAAAKQAEESYYKFLFDVTSHEVGK